MLISSRGGGGAEGARERREGLGGLGARSDGARIEGGLIHSVRIAS